MTPNGRGERAPVDRPRGSKRPGVTASGGPGPRGRADVMEAVIAAAADLFAERGPDSVSIREIAEAAGVNHALIHRHFGSKEALLKATLSHLAEQFAAASDPGGAAPSVETLLQASFHVKAYARMVAWGILAGKDPRDLQTDFPAIHRAIERRSTPGNAKEAREARITVAVNTATLLGWLLYERFLVTAAGLDPEDQQSVVHRLNNPARNAWRQPAGET
jgi:TetR/AcrR family transcriptional regulator, repressor for neighboring sulfatase